ncbi:MAG: hypothetical protein ACTS8P_05220 [Arsenophonus sp. NC-XBC3-MAG3]
MPKGNAGYEPFYKGRPILELTDSYMKVLGKERPGKELYINESMVKFNSRLNFKQYLPSKPSAKCSIKIWNFADSHIGNFYVIV